MGISFHCGGHFIADGGSCEVTTASVSFNVSFTSDLGGTWQPAAVVIASLEVHAADSPVSTLALVDTSVLGTYAAQLNFPREGLYHVILLVDGIPAAGCSLLVTLPGPVIHPDCPDAVGLPAAAVAEFLQLAPKYVYATTYGVQLTLQRNKDRLNPLADGLLPDQKRFGSKAYHRYVHQRDPADRKTAETRALQARARLQGQLTLHEYQLDIRPQDSRPHPDEQISVTSLPRGMITPAFPRVQASESLPSITPDPPDFRKFSSAVKRLEDALTGARESASELNTSLGTIEEPGNSVPDAGDEKDARDRSAPLDSSVAPEAQLPADPPVKDPNRAAMLMALEKLAASDFDADLDAKASDHKYSKEDLLAAVGKFANSDFEAGENEKMDSKSTDDISQADSTAFRRARRTKG